MVERSRFKNKKQKILTLLDAPGAEYRDLSPKGSIDEPIRPLIAEINAIDGLVTTSSCSGRISVFLEGNRSRTGEEDAQSQDANTRAGPGGKGGGGSWLFVSHDPVDTCSSVSGRQFMRLFQLQHTEGPAEQIPDNGSRFIHLKFEPMILHILASSLDDTHRVLTAALSSGFRESGAVSLGAAKPDEITPMVAVRSTGYSFDAIIGYQDAHGSNIALVDENYLQTLVGIANERFKTNTERINRFQSSLLNQYRARDKSRLDSLTIDKLTTPEWEDAESRRQRKREEGLARQRMLQAHTAVLEPNIAHADSRVSVDSLFDETLP